MVERHVATVGNDAIDELDLAWLERQRPITLVERLYRGLGQFGDHLVEDVVFVNGDGAKPPAGATEILRVRVDADGIVRDLAQQRTEAVHEGSVDVVGQDHQVGAFGLDQIGQLGDRLLAQCHSGRIRRIDHEEGLDLRILQLLDLFVGELEFVLLWGLDLNHLEVVILQVRHLDVGREDRRRQRNGIAGNQQAVGLQRLEEVAHRRRAALDRVDVELAGWLRVAANGPHQIFVHDLLVVHQHAVRHRIIVADDGIDELVHEGVRIEAKFLDGKG